MFRTPALNYSKLVAALFTCAVALAQDLSCPLPVVGVPKQVLNYPMTSDRYAVEYRFNIGGPWIDAKVYISYYGGTEASPYLPYSGYTLPYQGHGLLIPPITPDWETSMSFVSITVPQLLGITPSVQLRVTNLLGSTLFADGPVTVRPAAKGITPTVLGGQAYMNRTMEPGGEQFVLWWQPLPVGGHQAVVGGHVEGLAIFLNPVYEEPFGSNVLTVSSPTSLSGIPSYIDTVKFLGPIKIGGTGDHEFLVPSRIKNVYLGPDAWVQGKLRFDENGFGEIRRLTGPGVLDVSLFDYSRRHCKDTPDGYPALSFVPTSLPLPANSPGIRDQYIIQGIVITDTNFYATDPLDNTTMINVKTLGWNGNNDGLQFGTMSSARNVFVRSGDDSIKMWGSFTDVSNAVVWQNYNGGVINLGWFNNSPGENSHIDGVYIVSTDWLEPQPPTDPRYAVAGSIQNLNDAVVASEMVPGTRYGFFHPSLFQNIYLEDAPRVLFSLKIAPPRANSPNSSNVDFQADSVLNLNLQGIHTPPSPFENFLGFQTLPSTYTFPGVSLPTLPYTFTGSMNLGLYDVEIAQPAPPPVVLTDANAGLNSAGHIVKSVPVNEVITNYVPPPPGPQWYAAWAAPQDYLIPTPTPMMKSAVRMIVKPTISGTMVRVKLDNLLGTQAVTFSKAYFGVLPDALAGQPLPAALLSNTPLTFDGHKSLKLDKGKSAYSDPITLPIRALSRYAVSLEVDAVTDIGIHLFGLVTNYTAAAGNAASLTGDAFVPVPPTADPKKPNTFPVYWVAGLDVASTFNTGTVVALGDSITDGRCSTRDANGVPADTSTSPTYPDEYLSWPDLLARRLLGFKAVVNQGIAGNEITGGAADSLGQPALVRVASDVLAQQGATHVIFLEGTNDIAANAPLTTTDVANEIARLEEADQRIIADAHLIGLNVIGATILPRGGEAGWTVQMDLVRVALNDWIRTPGVFDGVIDFDGMMLLAGAKNRGDGVFTLPKGYHCYDGVHPNADGYALMAAGIDLALFSTPLRPR